MPSARAAASTDAGAGACRHGERCSRLHTKPNESKTLLFSNLYQQAKERVSMDPAEEYRLFVEVRLRCNAVVTRDFLEGSFFF